MKKLLLFIVLQSLVSIQLFSQWTNKSMTFGSLNRVYRVYQSPNYNPLIPAALLISMHGLGDNMTNFSGIGFDRIADTANFIWIVPQAATDGIAGTAWNCGIRYMNYTPNASVNDVGFINALIDEAIALYSINQERIYLCGFSLGGFMTNRMALQSNSRLAACASMSGTIGTLITNPNAGRNIPMAHFHGTADATIKYTGNAYGKDAEPHVQFWVANNNCDPTPVFYSYPNVVNDSITVERYDYSNGNPQSDVSFYKMIGATHTVLFQPDNDITEPIELWMFLRKHTLSTTGSNNVRTSENEITVFPNPVTNIFCFDSKTDVEVQVIDNCGKLVLNIQSSGSATVDMSGFCNGSYFVKFISQEAVVVKKIVKL